MLSKLDSIPWIYNTIYIVQASDTLSREKAYLSPIYSLNATIACGSGPSLDSLRPLKILQHNHVIVEVVAIKL